MAKKKKPHKHTSRALSASSRATVFKQRFDQAEKLLKEGSIFEAAPLCEALFRQDPDNPDVLIILGYLRYQQSRLSDAIKLLEPVHAAHPMDTQVRRLLIASYKDSNQIEQALTMARKFLEHPLSGEESLLAFQIFCGVCDWSSARVLQDKAIRQAIEGKGTIQVNDDFLLSLHGTCDVDPEDMLKLHQIAAAHEPSSLPCGFIPEQINPRRRLKIAYLSPDFFSHPVAYFVYPIITGHNRQQVEVSCYAHLATQDGDGITDKIRAAADHFIDITKMTDHDVACRIRADGIHVLIELAGHTAHSRLQVLSWRPAPVQISWLGYPNTSGMPEVDFHITDHHAECENGTRYTEKLLYMPDSFLCFGMRPGSPRREMAPAEMNGHITFGSFNHTRKMNPEVIAAWCHILNRVPGSRMALKLRRTPKDSKLRQDNNIVNNNILAEFAHHGIEEERILFLPFAPTYDDHIGQYNLIDIALDTFPYTGTTTTCEALWMGVPVMTLVGKTHANRVSYSILKNIGYTETIAYSVDEYVDKAVQIALNPGGLSILRKTLPSLFEYSLVAHPERFIPQLEDLYMDACRQSGMDISRLTAVDMENVLGDREPDEMANSVPQDTTNAHLENLLSKEGCDLSSENNSHPTDRKTELITFNPAFQSKATQAGKGTKTVRIENDVLVVVPDNLNMMTPYILEEQQDWFEDEIKFVRHLIKPGMQVIDIGANYGCYALTMAKLAGAEGRLWAFEPCSSTADHLQLSIDANGLDHIELIRAALSNRKGEACLSTQDNAELNSLSKNNTSTGMESVPLFRLDDCMKTYDWTNIDFLKLDAEGEEVRILEGGEKFFRQCSPLVMFELKHGEIINERLIQAFRAISYEIYRFIPGLMMLVPFDMQEEPDLYQLNLFCCKPDRAKKLLEAGLLTMNEEINELVFPSQDILAEYLRAYRYASPLLSLWEQSESELPGNNIYISALSAYATSQTLRGRPESYCWLKTAFFQLISALDEHANLPRLLTLARIATDMGRREAALQALNQFIEVLNREQKFEPVEPFLAASEHAATLDPADQLANWCFAQALAERERLQAFSSYFTGTDSKPVLNIIENLNYDDAEMGRRRELINRRYA